MADEDRTPEEKLVSFLEGEEFDNETLVKAMRDVTLGHEAQLVAGQAGYLTVEYGYPEDDESVRRIQVLLNAFDRRMRDLPEQYLLRGKSDSVTFVVPGPNADEVINDLVAVAQEHDPGYWRIERAESISRTTKSRNQVEWERKRRLGPEL